MHTLYISTTSPYTRILLMITALKDVDLALKFVMPWENPAELVAVNRFSQVPALLLETGECVTETPLIIQAIAPEIYSENPTHDLPRIAKAFGILAQGVRAYSTERFALPDTPPHPFVARSKALLKDTLPTLPTLSADSPAFGDKILLCALIWVSIRLPDVFDTLSPDNKHAVHAFHQSPLMQKLNAETLEKKPTQVTAL